MFKRKLTALQYPNQPESFNVQDAHHVRNLIVWLEDQKIRHYKIEDRKGLRDVKAKGWNSQFKKYLEDLGCPLDVDNLAGVVDWLLGLAVRMEYGDNVDKYKEKTAENVSKTKSNVPQVITQNPLDNLAFDSDEFKMGVNDLALMLNVTKHPDHLMTLKAVSRLIAERFSATVPRQNDATVGGKPVPLQDIDLGFDTGDPILNQAAKILRLLYVHDTRDLQTKINEAIVAVQAITANPKTDSSLGKVGK